MQPEGDGEQTNPPHVPWYKAALSGAWQILTSPKQDAQAIGRGALKAVQSTAHLAAWLETHVTDGKSDPGGPDPFWSWYNTNVRERANAAGGAWKFLFGGPSGDEQMQWYQNHIDATQNEIRNRLLGPDAKDGPMAFVENASEFITGMYGAGKFLKLGKGSSLLGRLGIGATEGAVADFTAFMPSKERLSNMVANGPDSIVRPLGQLLATQDTDSELTARLKAAGEGLITGGVFMAGTEAVAKAFRWVMGANKAAAFGLSARASRTADLAAAGKLDPELASRSIQADLAEAQRLAGTPDAGAAVESVRGADGEWTLQGVGQKPFPEAPKFRSQAEADARAAQINEGARNGSWRGGTVYADEAGTTQLERRSNANMESPTYQRRATDAGRTPPAVPTAEPTGVGNGPVNPDVAKAYREEALRRMTPEARAAFEAEIAKPIREGADPRTVVDAQMDNSTLRTKNPSNAAESLQAIQSMEAALPDVPNGTAAASAHLMDDLSKDLSPQQWIGFANSVLGSTTNLNRRLIAMRTWVVQAAKNARDMARVAEQFPESPVANKNLQDALQTLHNLHQTVKASTSNVGSALESSQEKVLGEQAAAGITRRAPGAAGDVFAGRTPEEIRSMARMVLSADNPGEVLAAINTPKSIPPRGVKPQAWLDRVNAYRMEAMLSGPRTQIINAVSNAMAAVQRPIEMWWAGARSGNSALRMQGADTFAGLFTQWGESWRAAYKAWKVGENILDPGRTHVGQDIGQSTLSRVAPENLSWLKTIYNAPDRLLPSSMLRSIDEFFQQLNYRSNLRSQILRQARQEGITDATEIARRLTSDFQFGFDPKGAGVNPLALDYSRVSTFKNNLGSYQDAAGQWHTTVGQDVQDFVQNHPLARQILPFVRTPVNLFRWQWERTPILNRFSKLVQADLRAGGERAAIAKAKVELGGLMWGTAAVMAYNGLITGKGPGDPKLRQEWLGLGNQPYTLTLPFGLGKINLRRADPTLSMFAIAADIVQAGHDLKEEDHQNVLSAFVAAVASNMLSKTFMQSVTSSLDAFASNDPNKWNSFAQNYAGTYVPNLVNQTNPDDAFREVRSMWDEIASRIPGLSTTLEPRRNFLGDSVMAAPGYLNNTFNPFTWSPSHPGGEISDQLISFGRALTMPPENMDGVDLTDRTKFPHKGQTPNAIGQYQSPYDRWMELMGQETGGMPPMRKLLTDLFQTDQYKNGGTGTEEFPGGLRFQLANSLVQAKKGAAWAQLLTEYPTLLPALMQQSLDKAGAVIGQPVGQDTSLSGIQKQFKGALP